MFDRWISYLAVALDLDELDTYQRYVFAGGEPKKFKWATSDHAGTRPEGDIANEIVRGITKGKNISDLKKKDVWEYGQVAGFTKVTKANKWEEQPDGSYKMVGEVWVNEKGEEIDTSGYAIVESESEGAVAFAKSVAERLH